MKTKHPTTAIGEHYLAFRGVGVFLRLDGGLLPGRAEMALPLGASLAGGDLGELLVALDFLAAFFFFFCFFVSSSSPSPPSHSLRVSACVATQDATFAVGNSASDHDRLTLQPDDEDKPLSGMMMLKCILPAVASEDACDAVHVAKWSTCVSAQLLAASTNGGSGGAAAMPTCENVPQPNQPN